MPKTPVRIGQTVGASASALAGVALLSLTGCGASFKAVHVPSADLPTALATQPGIYYALPKTELSVVVPVAVTIATPAPFGNFEQCLVDCVAGTKAACTPKADEPVATALLQRATFKQLSVPDADHIYRVDADTTNPFMTLKHEFGLDQGVLKTATLFASNQTFTVLSSALGSLLGVKTFPTSAPAAKAAPGKHQCDAATYPGSSAADSLFKDMGALNRHEAVSQRIMAGWVKKAPMSCPQVQCLSDTLLELRMSAAAELADANDYLLSAPAGADLATVRLQQAASRSALFQSRAEALAVLVGLNSKTEKQTVVATAQLELTAPETQSLKLSPWLVRESETVSPDDGQPFSKEARAQLTRCPVVVIQTPLAVAMTGAQAVQLRDGVEGGYRYRMPAPVRFEVQQLASQSDPKNPCAALNLADERLAIAQYGALAALPYKFSGMDASLAFVLDAEGALKKVSFGQTAQSAAPLKSLVDDLNQRNADNAAAPLIGAAAQTDLADQRIKADKQRRCQEALVSLPATAAWPDICK